MELEYFKALVSLDQQLQKAKTELAKQYAFKNNPHKVGDIITDGMNKIKITKINWSSRNFTEFPCCVYKGNLLNDENKIIPKKEEIQIWQHQLLM